MDPATRLNRHTQLWSAGETSVRRIGIGGAIFALITLLTVIEPYHIKSADTNADIIVQKSEVRNVKAELVAISEIQVQLDGLLHKLANEPWTDNIEQLKNDFIDGAVTQPKIHSAKALDAIAEELQNDIVKPLRVVTAQPSVNTELAQVPEKLDKAVVQWLAKYRNTEWWATGEQKINTAAEIGDELTPILKEASIVASELEKKLKAASKEKTNKLNVIESELNSLLTDLQKVMDRAMPAWARHILNVKQLLVLFPWLVAGIAMYLVGTALRASRHFHAMADGENWSAEDRRDPLLSSSWTLTPRGAFGSFAAFATYGSVLGVLGGSLYRSLHPPLSAATGSVQASVDILVAQSNMSALVAYGALLVAIFAVGVTLYMGRD